MLETYRPSRKTFSNRSSPPQCHLSHASSLPNRSFWMPSMQYFPSALTATSLLEHIDMIRKTLVLQMDFFHFSTLSLIMRRKSRFTHQQISTPLQLHLLEPLSLPHLIARSTIPLMRTKSSSPAILLMLELMTQCGTNSSKTNKSQKHNSALWAANGRTRRAESQTRTRETKEIKIRCRTCPSGKVLPAKMVPM